MSALRFALGAVILCVCVRPRIVGRGRTTWVAIVVYGISLAALNLTYLGAIERIPMGIAVTFAFVAPLVLAITRSRRRRDVVMALLAGAGVVLLGGIDRPDSITGLALGVACGACWIVVAYAGQAVGARTRSVEGLALALPVAALVTVPLGLPHAGSLDGRALTLGLAIALVGLIVPFALELEGLRRLEPRAVAIIYSIDPAIAAVVGLVFLGEDLSLLQVIGMIAVMAATTGVTATASAEATDPRRLEPAAGL